MSFWDGVWVGVLVGVGVCVVWYKVYGWYQDAQINRRRATRAWGPS